MKITLFTSNSLRHNYLINLLSECCTQLFVIQEKKKKKSQVIPERYQNNQIMKKYFTEVDKAEKITFKKSLKKKNIIILKTNFGNLSKLKLQKLSTYLKSDLYIVFGSSYIKGRLVEFLIKKKAINIHAGISPYYRGTDCNFWALYDNNPHLVGSTIHFLSRGLDDGPILYHAISNINTNTFVYTMSSLKSAFLSLAEKINGNFLKDIKPLEQSKKNQIRYSKKKDFNEEILKKYYKKKINLNFKKTKNIFLKDPFILK